MILSIEYTPEKDVHVEGIRLLVELYIINNHLKLAIETIRNTIRLSNSIIN